MRDVMLYGEGWNGEVRNVEEGIQRFTYIPVIGDPNLREVVFSLFLYESIDKNSYWLGYSGTKPLRANIEEAIFNYKPIPALYP
ncbi:hypothetical protein MXL48_05040 [Klebsiella quasipneumoniae]|uniref:hypothetical protein n=1 Tax=Klebsiella TaxID=570 RepID=UPI002B059D5E|nr:MULTISPECIES: hypothetical protein [Klebsiella]MEB6482471.1 hypothetical protein [Klebsiella quasipneumoniae]